MIQIDCPWCGVRDEEEFTFGGQTHIQRPEPPEEVTDEEWANYLFNRINPKGIHFERWRHTFGCRQWFNMARDTVTHEIITIYRMGDPAPDLSTTALPGQVNPGVSSKPGSSSKPGTSSKEVA